MWRARPYTTNVACMGHEAVGWRSGGLWPPSPPRSCHARQQREKERAARLTGGWLGLGGVLARWRRCAEKAWRRRSCSSSLLGVVSFIDIPGVAVASAFSVVPGRGREREGQVRGCRGIW
jgi:hypothetical protein